MTQQPKYHLLDVHGDLRARVLDLCTHRLWQDALELLQQHGFMDYDYGDLKSFYDWAPAYLPEDDADQPRKRKSKLPEPEAESAPEPIPALVVPREPIDPVPIPTPPDTTAAQQLCEARQGLVNVLSAHANQTIASMSCSVTPCGEDPARSGASLLFELRDLVKRYVVLPDLAAETLALWVVHTYAFTLREITTYIGVVSPEKRCGKTTLLELLGNLAHETIAAANISPSALFRVIEQKQPTLIIDEADTFLHGRDEMAGILNAGYRKGNAYVMRVAEGKQRQTGLAKYSCWCPKVMAAIGRLPDTLADRCIVITMQRKLAGETCERLRDLGATQFGRRCAEFVEQHRDRIASVRPEIPAALNDRAADIWEPLLAIADIAGGEWPQLARDAALQLSASDNELTPLGYFLKDLRNWIVINKWDRVLSRDIVSSFNPVHDRPWEDLRRGREINEWWLSLQLRGLGLRPKMMRAGEARGRGYLFEEVEAVYRRYVPTVETPVAAAEATLEDSKEVDRRPPAQPQQRNIIVKG
jgi:hypothetical protein